MYLKFGEVCTKGCLSLIFFFLWDMHVFILIMSKSDWTELKADSELVSTVFL